MWLHIVRHVYSLHSHCDAYSHSRAPVGGGETGITSSPRSTIAITGALVRRAVAVAAAPLLSRLRLQPTPSVLPPIVNHLARHNRVPQARMRKAHNHQVVMYVDHWRHKSSDTAKVLQKDGYCRELSGVAISDVIVDLLSLWNGTETWHHFKNYYFTKEKNCLTNLFTGIQI